MPKTPGRKTKLSPELIISLCLDIRNGMPYKYACAKAGISERVFHKWKSAGMDEGPKSNGKENKAFVQFVQSIKKADAEAIDRNVSLIQVAAKTSWQAAAWWLERRFPKDFGRVDRMGLFDMDGVEALSDGLSESKKKEIEKELGSIFPKRKAVG